MAQATQGKRDHGSGRLAFALLALLMLPSCSGAEESDTGRQAAADPIQLAQAKPETRASGSSRGSEQPNILVIWGDDVGYWNISSYNQGMMGYKTPNIDSIATEGALFTDWYAQQSCTAGRAAFILGQHPFRTGLLTIGMPGSEQGISDEMVTLATLLKPHGYVSGQFGKNHLGDRD